MEASSSVNATVKNTARGVSIQSETAISPLGSLLRSITNPQSRITFFCSPPLSIVRTGGLAFWKEASDVIVSSCRIKGRQPGVLIRVICWQKVLRWNKEHLMHPARELMDRGRWKRAQTKCLHQRKAKTSHRCIFDLKNAISDGCSIAVLQVDGWMDISSWGEVCRAPYGSAQILNSTGLLWMVVIGLQMKITYLALVCNKSGDWQY